MKRYPTPLQFVQVTAAAIVLLAIASTVIQTPRGEEAAVLRPAERGTADARGSELARCRTVTPDDRDSLESCRQLWAGNRQRFFLLSKSPQLPAASLPNASASSGSNQDRVLPHGADQGRAR